MLGSFLFSIGGRKGLQGNYGVASHFWNIRLSWHFYYLSSSSNPNTSTDFNISKLEAWLSIIRPCMRRSGVSSNWFFLLLLALDTSRNWNDCNKEQKRRRLDENWFRDIFPIPETKLKLATVIRTERSATPKQIPTKAIVCSVEAALSRQRKVSESIKDNIRSRIASTTQSTSLHDSSLAKDEQHTQKHE